MGAIGAGPLSTGKSCRHVPVGPTWRKLVGIYLRRNRPRRVHSDEGVPQWLTFVPPTAKRFELFLSTMWGNENGLFDRLPGGRDPPKMCPTPLWGVGICHSPRRVAQAGLWPERVLGFSAPQATDRVVPQGLCPPRRTLGRIVIVKGPGDPGETTHRRFGEPAN